MAKHFFCLCLLKKHKLYYNNLYSCIYAKMANNKNGKMKMIVHKKTKKILFGSLFILLLVLCAPVLAQKTQPALNPSRMPTLPSALPPVITPLPSAARPEDCHEAVEAISCTAGWQLITFPLGRVYALSGLPRMLYCRDAYGLKTIDPVNHPESLEPGITYIAYFDQPGMIYYAGSKNNGFYNSTRLYAGWNIIGCPADHPISRSNITVTRPGGITAKASDVCSPSITPGSAWLYSRIIAFANGKWIQGLDLGDGDGYFRPGQAAAIFCWTEMSINWNVEPPASGIPKIGSVGPTQAAAGEEVLLFGSGFGETGHGCVYINQFPVQPEDVLSWTPKLIKFRLPYGAESGKIRVIVNKFPSNTVAFKVVPSANTASVASQYGTLMGEVFSSTGYPLPNAQVVLDDGQSAVTDLRGGFRFSSLHPHPTKIYVTLPGYKSASGTVNIAAGNVKTLKVSLSPVGLGEIGAESPEQDGLFIVAAYPYQDDGHKYWVNKIEVWEYGNYSKRWSRTWWEDPGLAKSELYCKGAPIGRSYQVIVTWKNHLGDEKTQTWTPEFTNDNQTFSYYNP